MGVNGIYGLSGSGMDIESMVKVGMMSRQNEYDKMAQKFTKNEWMKADYIELNSKITTFNASTLSQYKMSNTMNAKSVESSSEAVKVSANSNAALMSHSVEVTALSSNAYLVGTNNMTRYAINGATSADSTSTKLADVLFSSLDKTADGRVYGLIAPTDMADDSRDIKGYKDKDGKSISSEWNIGKVDEHHTSPYASHWLNTSTNERIFDNNDPSLYVTSKTAGTGTQTTYLPDASLKSLTSTANDWRWRELNGEQYWLVKDSSERNGWRKVYDPHDSVSDWASFTNFVKENSDLEYVPYTEWDTTATGIGNLASSEWAFEFTIGDGTKKIDAATGNEVDNEVTIHYSYDDLLGNGTTEGKTFVDLVADINKQANGLNIKAAYDADHDTFSFYNTKSGSENGIIIKFGTDDGYENARASLAARNFFNNMGLYVSKNGELYGRDKDGDDTLDVATETDQYALKFNISNGSKSDGVNSFMGENGSMKIDGVTYNDVVDNKLTVAGVTYTAVNTTGTTDSNGVFQSTGAATVSVTQDTDSIIDKVKSFITDYNKLLADLYAKYDEKPNSDYKPLTQSQKDQMKEEQITKWEEKAKQGLLYHDQTLGKIIMNMRNAVSEKIEGVDSKYNSVYGLGVSTTGLKGQLVLDEDKLKTALANDPDAVYNVFAKLESTTTNNASAVYKVDNDGNVTSTSNGNGIAQRLGDIFVSATKLIKDRAGSSSDITEDSDLNNLLRNLQTKMSNFKRLMTSFENALYKKYDAMESTLARLGTQLNYIMGSTGQ